ncbi:hypothetical protein BGZ50_008245 [Haplosporangium sp. Z 11]|nr:hypothetical protein BGZ50_008245 [Haplosporangium sp. Z 11]
MTDINGHQLWGKSNDYLDQMEKQHVYQMQPSPFGFQTKLESYHNGQSITDCDAQPEPRQVRYRACQISNDQYPSSAHQSLSPSSHRHQHQSSHPPHFYTGDPSHHQFSHPHQSYQHYLYEQNHARSIELHNSIDHHHMYYTHHHYGDNLFHANQEHQRSFSLMHAEEISSRLQTDSPPPTAPRFEDLSPAEQVRQEHYWRRQRHQIHNQQMQLRRQQQHYHQQSIYAQHWHHSHQYHHKFVTHSRPYHFNQERQVTSLFIPSAHELDWYPSSHRATKAPSAQDLAWERHCYYQQLQLHEEAIAEQKWTDVHRQRLQQQQQQQQGRLSVPEQDLVSRTSSLSRITSSSLSPQAAQALGLSRSKSTSTFEPWRENTVQKHQKVRQPSSGESGYPKSIIVDCPILSAGRRLIKRNGIKATSDIGRQTSATTSEALDPTSDSPQPSTPLQHQQRPEAPLSRKKTLRDLAPSIRSLARRCSSRFSSRPSSFAGSSSDLALKYSEEKITIGSLNLKASHMSLPASGNTAQLLTSGPDGAIDLEMVPQSEASTTIPITCDYTPSMSTPSLPLGTVPERIPIHRKVALFRSKTTTHPRARDTSPNCNISETKTSNTDTSSTRSRSLTSPQRRSLRLANGHGLDLTMSSPNTITTTDSTIVSSASQDIEKSTSELDKALFIDAHCAEEDPQEAARRQVAALLAMGRKDRVSAKTGQVITRSTPPQSETHISPLAVEAQQDMPLDSSTSEQKLFVKEDPCEHIAFMLVPKSRYEFQPLVVM